MQTAVLCYTQPLNNGIFTAYEYFFWIYPFLSRIFEFLPVIKRLRNSWRINFILLPNFQVHKNLFVQKDPDFLKKMVESYLHNCLSERIFLKT